MTDQQKSDELRVLDEAEVAEVAGGEKCVVKEVFSYRGITLAVFTCDDGSYGYGVSSPSYPK